MAYTYPSGLVDALFDRLASLNTIKLRKYAGEFESEEEVKRLHASVVATPHVLGRVMSIQPQEPKFYGDPTTYVEDDVTLVLFVCGSNYRSDADNHVDTLNLTHKIRAYIHGAPAALVDGTTVHFRARGISEVLHNPGLMVFGLEITARVPNDLADAQ